MKTTTLLIMAAGIGSRFGTGIKQLEPVDDTDHIIMDYSIHDAIEAGFNHVVFIIRKDIEEEFKDVIGDRIASVCSAHDVTVDYVFQDIKDIPGTLPEGRTKPWGTGQAVLAAKKVIKTPFIVINADDYYGREGFKAVHEYLMNGGKEESQMTNLNSLFLSQAYKDCWDDYNRSLKLRSFPRWDYVILTASNEQQAEGFRKQIADRQNFLPRGTKFVAIPDRDGRRVGSGGATLEVLRYLHEQEGSFDSLRVLVIHSGGDSKRVPQYSALGKLFSPVPHELPNGRSSTLFDEFMICMSSVPSRIREGMVLLSGDVLLLFNPLQIDYNSVGAAAISFKENVETGKNHGVYLNGPDGNVKCCLQKKSVEVLREAGAVNESGCVDIDTGALIFSTDIMKSLYSLIETDADYDRNVNERTRLSLYADFLYPLASDSTLEDFYREKPEGEFCPELTAARTRVWEVLRPYRMKLLRLAPAKFIHFGTTREILELMNGGVDEYHYLGWSRKVGSSIRSDVSGYNSVLSSRASVGKDCYLEVSYVHGNSRIGSHSVLSYIDVQDQVIPDNVVLHGLKQRNGKFIVRIFGVNDNPKENRLFGRDLDELEDTLGVRFWEENGQAHTLWSAALYQESDTIREAVDAALELYEIVTGGKDFDRSLWTAASHKSLCAGFNEADPDAIIAWNKRMADLVTMDGIAKAIRDQVPAGSIRKLQSLTKIQKEWLEKRLRKADFGEKMRLHYYLGVILEDENEVQECFRIIQSEVLEATIKSLAYNEQARIVTDHHTVRLPLRVNWGGGWSDTPPSDNLKPFLQLFNNRSKNSLTSIGTPLKKWS